MAKKNKNEKKQQEVSIDLSSIPMHTMLDDLNELSGKPTQKISQVEKGQTAQASPFLDAKTAAPPQQKKVVAPEKLMEPEAGLLAGSTTPDQGMAQSYTPDALPAGESSIIQEPMQESKTSILKYVIIGLLIIAIIGAAGLGYYYWMSQQVQPPVIEEPIVEPEPEQEPEPESVSVYKVDEINYVTIDTETDNAQTVSTLLLDIADQIQLDNLNDPVRFVFIDVNGNPIAFPIFSMISGFSLPEEVVNNLEEDFAIYFYQDGANIRLGLDVEIKGEQGSFIQIMLANEASLADTLTPLLLSSPVSEIKKNNLFQDGSYGIFATRYINLNDTNTLSVDYAITNGRLIIGTSKETIRAVLDEVQKNNYSNNFETAVDSGVQDEMDNLPQ